MSLSSMISVKEPSLIQLLHNANVAVAVRLVQVYLNMFLPEGIVTLIN